MDFTAFYPLASPSVHYTISTSRCTSFGSRKVISLDQVIWFLPSSECGTDHDLHGRSFAFVSERKIYPCRSCDRIYRWTAIYLFYPLVASILRPSDLMTLRLRTPLADLFIFVIFLLLRTMVIILMCSMLTSVKSSSFPPSPYSRFSMHQIQPSVSPPICLHPNDFIRLSSDTAHPRMPRHPARSPRSPSRNTVRLHV